MGWCTRQVNQLLGKIWFVVMLSFLYKSYFQLETNLYTPYVYTRCARSCRLGASTSCWRPPPIAGGGGGWWRSQHRTAARCGRRSMRSVTCCGSAGPPLSAAYDVVGAAAVAELRSEASVAGLRMPPVHNDTVAACAVPAFLPASAYWSLSVGCPNKLWVSDSSQGTVGVKTALARCGGGGGGGGGVEQRLGGGGGTERLAGRWVGGGWRCNGRRWVLQWVAVGGGRCGARSVATLLILPLGGAAADTVGRQVVLVIYGLICAPPYHSAALHITPCCAARRAVPPAPSSLVLDGRCRPQPVAQRARGLSTLCA